MESIPKPLFRVVVAAPLASPPDHRVGAPPPAAALPVDAEGLDAVVAACVGTLRLRVANRLTAEPAELDVELPIDSMATFRPEAVAAHLPTLVPWVALRRLVGEAVAGRLTVEQLRGRLRDEVADATLAAQVAQGLEPATSPPATPREAPAGAVDAILDMVDLPEGARAGEGGTPPPARRVLGELVAGLMPARGHAVEARAATRLCDELDGRISAQLDEVFGDPCFRALEAVWRTVALLARRVGQLEGVRLEVVCAVPGEEAATLRRAVVEPWYAGEAAAPPSLQVVAHPFDATPPSLALLRELAALGEEVQAPVVTEVGDRFFGPDGRAAIPSLAIHLDGDTYAGWRALRDREASRWLVSLYNRICLRTAHGGDPSRRRPFTYREAAGPLWGSPAFVAALLACEGFGATGWPGPVAGEVEGLDLAGDRATEGGLDPGQVATLADHGIGAVAPVPGRDRVRLGPSVTVHRPRHDPSEQACRLDRARCDLAYPLVVGQLVALLHHLTPGLAGRPDGEAAAAVERAFRGRLGDSATIEVAVVDHPDRVDCRLLQLAVTPPAEVLASRAPVEMAVAIPR